MIKHPLCIATVIYILGILIGLYLSLSIALLSCICMMIGIIIYLITHQKRYIILLLILYLGIVQIHFIDADFESKYKMIQEDDTYLIKAVIVSDVNPKEYKDVYETKITEIEGIESLKETKWLLQVKRSNNEESKLQYGDLIALTGQIEIPSKARNYGGFDYRQYLKSKRIYGTIQAKENIQVLEKDKDNIYAKILHDVTNDIKNRMYQVLPNDIRELCVGILIGERTDLSEEMNEAFKESNLTHILAVSGSHISYIVLGLSILLSKTGRRFQKVFTIAFLIFFMGLTKYTPSVQRASIMSIIILMGSLLHRKSNVYYNLCFSAMIILLWNPYTVLDIGFQLSYGGTIGIVCLNSKIKDFVYRKIPIKQELQGDKKIKKYFIKLIYYILDMLIITISANIIIIPIMMLQFNTISATFWISNILAGPLIGMITILGFIVYFISIISMDIAIVVAFPLKVLLTILIWIAENCAKIPFSMITVKTPYMIEMILYYGMIYCFCNDKWIKKIGKRGMNRLRKYKLIMIVILMITIMITVIISMQKKLRIYFVDVGQGDCTLICTPRNKNILIDGGGSENGSFDVGEQTVFPYLLDRRITTIDYMLVSHFDTDHVGSLLYILEHMKVKNVVISKQGEICENYIKFKELLKEKNINVIIVKQGDKLIIDKDIYFDILFPEDELINKNVLNNNSIVAKLLYNNFSMLFTGDIEAVAEKELTMTYKNTDMLKATVLKVAHHGSKSSSIQEILDLVHPKIAVIGVGEKNTFGHPNEGVLERLQSLNCKIYRTDKNGEIIVHVNKQGKIKIKKTIAE